MDLSIIKSKIFKKSKIYFRNNFQGLRRDVDMDDSHVVFFS